MTITAARDSSEEDELLSQNSTRLARADFLRAEGGYPSEATMQGSEGEDSIDRRSKIAREGSLLVSCTWCERLHAAEDPLEFNPICSTCAGVARA